MVESKEISSNRKEMTLKKGDQIRQGDLLFELIEDFDTVSLDTVPRDNGRVVIAYGERTGHAHAFKEDRVFLYENKEDKKNGKQHLYLVVDNDKAVLSHEEHPPITFDKGKYKVINQRQYVMREVRLILD